MSGTSDGDDSEDSREYRNWSHDLASLQQIGEELLEEWRAQKPNSPRDYPTVRWMTANGYSHLRHILRVKHDMGTPEFFTLFTSAGSKEYEWHIDDVATIERANAYLEDRVECRDWAHSTLRTNRARINEVLRRFNEEYGESRVIALANDPSVETEVYDAFKEVGKSLRDELVSDESVHQYVRDTHRFFEWLDRSSRIEYDPMSDIEEEFRWEFGSEPSPLMGSQVKRLWIVAETDEERMLVIGYCVWGVRTKELPAIHVDQFDFDADDPKIVFEDEDRKNGQGEVTLMFGLDALASLLDKRARQPDWNGCLFPSDDDERPALCGKTMRKRFTNLCRKAGVTIDGEVPTPKQGRSFYYNILADAETDLLEFAAKAAQEQGGVDATSVRDYYLTEERRRHYRRVFFRQRIRQILTDDAFTPYGARKDYDSSLDDFE